MFAAIALACLQSMQANNELAMELLRQSARRRVQGTDRRKAKIGAKRFAVNGHQPWYAVLPDGTEHDAWTWAEALEIVQRWAGWQN